MSFAKHAAAVLGDTRALACAGAMLFGSLAAQASEATLIADRAGFLIGHAHRCGVEEGRVLRSRGVVDELISAFALDGDDKETAETKFAERFLASALAELIGDPAPSCTFVLARLARFEQHRPPPARQPDNQREQQIVRDKPSNAQPRRTTARTKPPKTAKPSSTRREGLSPEQRADLELKRAARQTRGRPPSI